MGFRFRKSINLGGGIKLNFSKSGVGISAGIPGFRVTKKAGGRTQTTIGIPGTGISYTTSSKAKKKTSSAKSSSSSKNIDPQLRTALQQAKDSAKLINSTVKPDVFFGRVNFLLDTLLYMQTFERTCSFRTTPTQDYNRILQSLNATVNDFIDRSYAQVKQKADTMKTEKGRLNTLGRYAQALEDAFSDPHKFWTGNDGYPHYTDQLYTEDNLRRAKEVCAEIQNKIAAAQEISTKATTPKASASKSTAPSKKKSRIPIPKQLEGASLLFQHNGMKLRIVNQTEVGFMHEANDFKLEPRDYKGDIVLMHGRMAVAILEEKAEIVRDWLKRGDPILVYLEDSDETAGMACYSK